MSTDTIGGPGGLGAAKRREIQLGRATLRCLLRLLFVKFRADAFAKKPGERFYIERKMSRLHNAEAHVDDRPANLKGLQFK
jgi:hypothetical protein